MSEFKLLAIRPLKGCHRRFAKNLNPGMIYPIYNAYSYLDADGNKITGTGGDPVMSIEKCSHFPTEIYDQISADGKCLKVSVSAIAGKNGSGKSTLIELLFSSIYLHCINVSILNPNLASISESNMEFESEKQGFDKRERDLAETQRKLRKWVADDSINKDVAFFRELKERVGSLLIAEKELMERREFVGSELKANKGIESEIVEFGKNLKAEIYFEMNATFYCLRLDGQTSDGLISDGISYVRNEKMPEGSLAEINHYDLSKHFFYTVAVNYSHYALNSFHIGDWINSLFHKNDGYSAPVVINPMRTGGNFDINSEMNFARYRLLANKLQEWDNVSSDEKVFVSDDRFIKHVVFRLDREKINAIPKHVRFRNNEIRGSIRENNLLTTFLSGYLDLKEQVDLLTVDFALKDIIANYIINKIDSIPKKYPWFGKGYQFSEETPFVLNEKFFQDIFEDGSHITYKLKQAVHFLKYCLSTKGEQMFGVKRSQLQGSSGISFKYSLNQIFDWSAGQSGASIMTTLPPSIFDIDFELSDNNGHLSKFTGLSSGEQQLTHTIQSVIYHINNLQSVHLGKGERPKYSSVNIVYDEIELYFHPEYQRRFVNRLLTELTRFYQNGRTNITSINILLLTHSPFILSDIPRENILLLESSKKNGRAVPKIPASQTFAANINDLLADGFFITGTLMGEFAEVKIKEAVARIKDHEMTHGDAELLKNIGDSFLKASLDNFKKRQND